MKTPFGPGATSVAIVLVTIVPLLIDVVSAETGRGAYSAYGSPESRNFWSPQCSAVGVSVAFSSVFSIMFYVGMLVVIIALLAGAYHACFRLFTKDMFQYDW